LRDPEMSKKMNANTQISTKIYSGKAIVIRSRMKDESVKE